MNQKMSAEESLERVGTPRRACRESSYRRRSAATLAALLLLALAGESFADPLSGEFIINDETSLAQEFPSLALVAEDTFIVVWESDSQDGSGEGIFARFVDSGGPVGPDIPINDATDGDQQNPAVGVGRDVLVVTWEGDEPDLPGFEAYSRVFDHAGTPLTDELRLNEVTDGMQRATDVAVFDSCYYAVWEANLPSDGFGFGIRALQVALDNSPLAPPFFANLEGSGQQRNPDAAGADSTLVVVWQSDGQDGDEYGIFGRIFDVETGSGGSEFQVNTLTAGDQENPSVDSNLTGEFVVVWQSRGSDGDNWGIAGRLFDGTGTPLGDEFPVNATTEGAQWRPSVAMSPDGDFVVTWHDAAREGIYARLFDSEGDPLGAEIQVYEAIVGGVSSAPEPAFDSLNRFLVVWRGADESSVGVLGRWFDCLPTSFVPIPGSATERLARAFPNPFFNSATIRFPGARSKGIAEVFDSGGRLVRRLEARQASGGLQAHWDGKYESGGVAPRGVYYCRALSGRQVWSTTLIRLR